MEIGILYRDAFSQPLGRRTVAAGEAVIDPVLVLRGGSADIQLSPAPRHLTEIGVFSPDDEPGSWIWEAMFEFDEFPADSQWFRYTLMNDLLARHTARIAAVTGHPFSDEPWWISADQGAVSFELWDHVIPCFVLTSPLAPGIPFGEVARIVHEVESIAAGLVEEVNRLSEGVQTVTPPVTRPASAFVCHSGRDKPFVRKLTQGLRTHDVDVWLDEEKILVGHDFTAKMEEGLQDADFVIVVLSPNFVTSGPWAQEEFRTALARQVSENRVRILPVLRKDCEIPGMLKTKNFADFRTSFDFGLARLVRSIKTHGRGS